jgi:hypothetical protein
MGNVYNQMVAGIVFLNDVVPGCLLGIGSRKHPPHRQIWNPQMCKSLNIKGYFHITCVNPPIYFVISRLLIIPTAM